MRKKWTGDLLLATAILLLAGILYLFLRPGGDGAWAVVSANGQEIARYALNEDQTVTLGDTDYNILQISGGAASIVEANCGDHTCVRTGPVRKSGETIVCLPHRLVVRIESGEPPEFDGSVG